jgi:hypothetical protein
LRRSEFEAALKGAGNLVLRRLSKEISECYRLAQQARAWAEEATDPRTRKDLLLVERSWLILAQSYEHSEAVALFTGSQRRDKRGMTFLAPRGGQHDPDR